MVIITADDYGKSSHVTDSILQCFSSRRITSASAMVFMDDSERAASLAAQTGMEVGLHLNFTMLFNAANIPQEINDRHKKIISYLTSNKLAQILYNPFLAESFSRLFLVQKEEFIRLYGREPDFYNGHHHMHLCTNMLMGKILPKGARARRTFTFDQGEKNLLNLFYRQRLDNLISRRFISTDAFYSILPLQNHERHRDIFKRAKTSDVELEVHPENADEMDFLLGNQYLSLMKTAQIGDFQKLVKE